MKSKQSIYHLAQTGGSKRAVQVRVLTPSEKEGAKTEASKKLNEKSTVGELNELIIHEEVRMMLVKVTRDPVDADVIPALAPKDWIRLSAGQLALQTGPDSFDEVFGGYTDDEALQGICRRLHHVQMSEIEDIMGKAIEVGSED